jgi:hypothetical protein
MTTPALDYDVALSFAGEDRAYVDMVAENLKSRGVRVFYDDYEKADLWGKDLYTHLSQIYRSKARYTLMFCSTHYANKLWTNHERKAAQSRAIEESAEYILPARFDDTEIPGLLPTTASIDLRTLSPVEVALLVCAKLGIETRMLKANQVPSPKSPLDEGIADFDYSSHDGRFRIGEGLCEIETRWTKASDARIHCTSDGVGVRGVALAPKDAAISDLTNVAALDFTSRSRTPELGRFVVFQNGRGIYALVQILEIDDDTRGKARDRLKFAYWILKDGSADFSTRRPVP